MLTNSKLFPSQTQDSNIHTFVLPVEESRMFTVSFVVVSNSKRNCHDIYLAISLLSNQRVYYRCIVIAHLSFVIQKLSVLKILQLTTIFFARWYKLSGSRSVPHSGSSNPHSGSSNPHSSSSNPHSGSSNSHSGSSNPPTTEPPIPVEIKAGQGVELSLDNFQVKLLCFKLSFNLPKVTL